MSYREMLTVAMTQLACDPRAVFLGQAVEFPGTAMFATLDGVPARQRHELPVFEDTQMGMAIGMALAGLLPVCLFPRWNFALCAANQIVNHLDKIPLYSGWRPQVIVRTAVPARRPLDPGAQHVGDFGAAFRGLLETVHLVELKSADDILPAYAAAKRRQGSTILVEYMELYG